MIGIKINDTWLDLDAGTRITLKLQNPIFADEAVIPGSFSLPFALPASGTNAMALQHPDAESNAWRRHRFTAWLYYDGMPYKRGRLIVDKANENRYDCSWVFGFAELPWGFKSRRIREVVQQEITVSNNKPAKSVIAKPIGSHSEYRLEVNGVTYSAASLAALATAISTDSPDENKITATYEDTGETYGVTGARVLIEPAEDKTDPFKEFEIRYDQSAGLGDWTFTSDPWAAWAADFALHIQDAVTAMPARPFIKWPFIANDQAQTNMRTASGYQLNHPLVVRRNVYHPFLHLWKVLEMIGEEYDVDFAGDFIEDPRFYNALIDNTLRMFHDQVYMNDQEFRFYFTRYNLAELVPDITIEDLLKGLAAKYNLALYWDERRRKIVMNRRKPIFLSTQYDDWTRMAGALDFVAQDNYDGVSLTAEREANDEVDVNDVYQVGDPGKEITSIVGSIKGDELRSRMYGPRVSRIQGAEFGLRLIWWVGFVESEAGPGSPWDYQRASHKDMEVTYEGEDALGEVDWAEYVRFLMNRKVVRLPVRMEYRHLNRIDWERKVMVNGAAHLVKSIDVSIGTDGMEVANVELFTL